MKTLESLEDFRHFSEKELEIRFDQLKKQIVPADKTIREQAEKHWGHVAKPLGSLGVLEEDIVRAAAAQGEEVPDFSKRALLIFCADNGVVKEGVSQTGQEVTAAVVSNMTRGMSCYCLMAEMEEEGSLERFARGWYWCKDCGYEKPEDYQYIEIAKVNPRAVICMDSAAWLAGMLKEEPATIAVATARTDRKKMDLENFEIRRFYFQNADIPGEICEKKTESGSYKYYSPKRTFCDCLRMNNKMPEEVKEEILTWCRKQKYSKEEILEYANKLRAVKNIEEEYQK